MHQKGHHSMTELSVPNLSRMTNLIHFLIEWTLKRGKDSEQVMEGSWGPEIDHIKHSGQIRNALLSHAMRTVMVYFGQFWCILVHTMCNPMTPLWLALTPPPFQVSITPFTPDMDRWSHSGQIQNTYLFYGTVTILVYFCPFWCASWATPQPLCIEFSSSHQKHVFYTSRAFKRYQPLLPCSRNTVLTWALFVG